MAQDKLIQETLQMVKDTKNKRMFALNGNPNDPESQFGAIYMSKTALQGTFGSLPNKLTLTATVDE
jgi:hypothetical protein